MHQRTTRIAALLLISILGTVGVAWLDAISWHRRSSLDRLVELAGRPEVGPQSPARLQGRMDLQRVRWEREFGWPLPALSLALRGSGTPPDDSLRSGLACGAVRLPVTPVWSGLVVNTAILSFVVALAALGVGTLRRRHSQSQLCCVKCAYPLAGAASTACPECGALVTSRIA